MIQDEQQRALLISHMERVQERVRKLEADLNALVRARRSESDDDEHDPEGETLSSQWSMRAGLLESARADLKQAEDAIQRFDVGTYGICVVCLKPIPLEQLEVRPFRESCVPCAS